MSDPLNGPLYDKLPPQNMEAEQSVLGSMLIQRQAVDKATAILSPDSFYRDIHRTIYEGMLALQGRSEPIDLTTLQEELLSTGMFEMVGGFLYLQNLMEAPSTAENVEYYAKIVQDKYTERRLLDSGTRIVSLAFSIEDGTAEDKVAKAEAILSEVGLARTVVTLEPLQPIVKEQLAQFHKRIEKRGQTGYATPFHAYNFMTGGLQRDELTIIAARPSMGKTSSLTQIALHHANEHGPVAFFSIEMSKGQIVQRILCSEARVDSNRARMGQVGLDEIQRMDAMDRKLEETLLFIDDSTAPTIQDIRSKARRQHARTPLSLVCIDYLQLIGGIKRGTNRTEEMGEVARGLKGLARDLHVPVVALAQLSRAVELRPDKRPILSDLRESGSIEAEADVVVSLYRDSYYKKHEEREKDTPADRQYGDSSEMETAEWIIGKQRNGPTGVINLGWIGKYTRFENLADRDDGPQSATRSPYPVDDDPEDPFNLPDNPYGSQWRT